MLEIHTLDEFRQAFEAKADEILVVNPDLAKKFILFNKVKKYLGIAGPSLNAAIKIRLEKGESYLQVMPMHYLSAPFIPFMGFRGFHVCVEIGAALGGVPPLKKFRNSNSVESADGGKAILRRQSQ